MEKNSIFLQSVAEIKELCFCTKELSLKFYSTILMYDIVEGIYSFHKPSVLQLPKPKIYLLDKWQYDIGKYRDHLELIKHCPCFPDGSYF